MSSKNHIKNPNEDSFRGIGVGKLGWTESGKVRSDLKRLSASFDNETAPKTKGKRIVVECKKCGRKFKTVSGKLPQHKPHKYKWTSIQSDYCNGGIIDPPTEILEAKTYHGEVIKVGDIIGFTLPKRTYYFLFQADLFVGKVTKIYQHKSKHISFEIEGEEKVFWMHEITKNLIYLSEEEYKEYKK